MTHALGQIRAILGGLRTTRGLTFGLGMAGLGLGVLLVAGGARPLAVRFALLPGDPVRSDLFAGDPHIRLDDLRLLEETRAAVAPGSDLASVWADLAMARLEIALRQGLSAPDSPALLESALVAQKKALALAPADVFSWARHTYLLLLIKGASTEAVQSLLREMDAAPYEPILVQSRANTAFYLYDLMDAPTQQRMADLFLLAWKKNIPETEKAAKMFGRSALLESILLRDPEATSWLGGRSLTKPAP